MPVAPLAGVQQLIAITSAKGGVGKSTVAVNLALSLAAAGKRVGLLDADVYGPSCAQLLGCGDKRVQSPDGKRLTPVRVQGLRLMSMALLLPSEQTPVIWRGPMATSALLQMLEQSDWGDLDYLLVDTPPGTGDIHLSFAQRAPITAAIVITTAEQLSLLDARKGIEMLNKVKVPIAGLVENMSYFRCGHCQQDTRIFGDAAVHELCAQYELPLLASIPIIPKLDHKQAIIAELTQQLLQALERLPATAAPIIEIN